MGLHGAEGLSTSRDSVSGLPFWEHKEAEIKKNDHNTTSKKCYAHVQFSRLVASAAADRVETNRLPLCAEKLIGGIFRCQVAPVF